MRWPGTLRIVDFTVESDKQNESGAGVTTSGTSAPGLRDVARLAGVSHQTVSRVINDSANIKETTRQRVLNAIGELNYRPNAFARALASGRSHRIGVLIESSSHFGPMSMLRGVEYAARAAGYTSTTCTVQRSQQNEFRQGVEFLLGQDVDALCVLAPRRNSLASIREHDLPKALVVIGSSPAAVESAAGAVPIAAVHVDQYAGGAWATRHLLECGHEVVAHVGGPVDWVDAQQREAGWRDALAAAGRSAPEVIRGDWTADSGYAAASRIAAIDGVTAVFAANDQMALGLIHGFDDLGISVPRDISIVGFDDIPESAHFLPPLTTVRQDFRRLGQLAVAEILHQLGEADAPETLVVAPEPVLRLSVEPAA